jgi:hypothetical protein
MKQDVKHISVRAELFERKALLRSFGPVTILQYSCTAKLELFPCSPIDFGLLQKSNQQRLAYIIAMRVRYC